MVIIVTDSVADLPSEIAQELGITVTRSRAKAADWLFRFAAKFHKVKALAVEHGSNVAEAKALAKRMASVFPHVPLYLSNVSPVIGTHAGPNVLAITILEED